MIRNKAMKDIKALRKVCKMKQYELAEKLGIEQSNFANIENGRLVPKHIDVIRHRCLAILMPKLDIVIRDYKFKLYELECMKNTLANNLILTSK